MKRKTVVICLIAMFALAAMGFGFAKWSDSVSIAATVETGKVCVGILDAGVLDPGADPQQTPGQNPEGKDVAKTTSTNIDNKCENAGVQYFAKIEEKIENAYPWYKTGSTIKMANCGTIPVKIEKIEAVWDDPDGIADFFNVAEWTLTDNGVVVGTGTGLDSLMTALIKYQLHPDHVLTLDITGYFAEEVGTDIMPEGASATATVTVTASQWNEVP
jgi:hypothetical protein